MKFTPKPLHKAMVGVFVGFLAVGQPAIADDRESLETLRETTLNLIDALVEQGIFSREKADAMVKAAQAKAAKAATREKPKGSTPVRVQPRPSAGRSRMLCRRGWTASSGRATFGCATRWRNLRRAMLRRMTISSH